MAVSPSEFVESGSMDLRTWRPPEFQHLECAIDACQFAEDMDSVEERLDLLKQRVLDLIFIPLLQVSWPVGSESEAAQVCVHRLPAVIEELTALLRKTLHLACSRRTLVEKTRESGEVAGLTAARKTIKESAWDLLQVRARLEQADDDRVRQELRIRELETSLEKEAARHQDSLRYTGDLQARLSHCSTSIAELERRLNSRQAGIALEHSSASSPGADLNDLGNNLLPSELEKSDAPRPVLAATSRTQSFLLSPHSLDLPSDETAFVHHADCFKGAGSVATFSAHADCRGSSATDVATPARAGTGRRSSSTGGALTDAASPTPPRRQRQSDPRSTPQRMMSAHSIAAAFGQRPGAPRSGSAGALRAKPQASQPQPQTPIPTDLRSLGQLLTGSGLFTAGAPPPRAGTPLGASPPIT